MPTFSQTAVKFSLMFYSVSTFTFCLPEVCRFPLRYCVCYLVFKLRFLVIAFAIWSFVASRRCNLSYLALTLLWFSLAIQIILLQFVGLWLIILASLLRLFCRFLCLFRLFPLLFFLAWFLFDSSTNDDIYARLLSVFSSHFIPKPPPNICIRSSTTPMQ